MDQTEVIREVAGQPALDRDGEDLGRVVDVFIDEETDAPKWVSLRSEGNDSLVLVPIAGADLEARPLRLGVDRAQVLSAPRLAPDEQRVSPEEEAEIERHYRGSATDAETPERSLSTEEAVAVDLDRPLGVDAPVEVLRSEEDLVVDMRTVGVERVRLIKRIVTEQVTRTIEVRHEELVIERETLDGVNQPEAAQASDQLEAGGSPPATRRERIADQLKERLPSLPAGALSKLNPATSGAFSGETTEITLMQEEVVVTKRIVPRERVRVRKEVVTEQREISDTLRKERVDIERDAQRRDD